MKCLEHIFLSLFQAGLNAGIMLIIITFIINLFKNKVSIRVKYSLIFLVILRLIIPIGPKVNVDITNIVNSYNSDVKQEAYNKNEYDMEDNISVMQPINHENIDNKNIINDNSISNKATQINDIDKNSKIEEVKSHNNIPNVIEVLSIIWLIGMSLMSMLFLIVFFIFKRKEKNLTILNTSEINKLKNDLIERLNIKRDIPIYVCDFIRSPCILGIFKPRIYVPRHLINLECNESNCNMEYIIMHELMHYKRKDIYSNLCSIAALILHWYNPIAWICTKKIKTYREYVCDAGVLEFLGEDDNTDYGMTLINFSKLSLNLCSYSKFVIGFDNNSEIKGRIEMIKKFKNGSYKLSKRAFLAFALSGITMLSYGVSFKAADAKALPTINEQVKNDYDKQIRENNNHEFIIDTNRKEYFDIKKLQEVCGFNFKVPDYAKQSSKVSAGTLVKVSDNNYLVNIYFDGDDIENDNYTVRAFEGDVVESIKRSEEEQYSGLHEGDTIESKTEDTTLNGIEGQKVITKILLMGNEATGEDYRPDKNLSITDFVWKDNDVWYSINYKRVDVDGIYEISEDEAGKVAASLKNINEVNNVNYDIEMPKTEKRMFGPLRIYDKEDLKIAKEQYLDFNPKMPCDIKEDGLNISIDGSRVMYTMDSKVKNDVIYYELSNCYLYNDKGATISFTASKHDTNNTFDNIKNNTYVEDNKKVDVKQVNIGNKDIYKSEIQTESGKITSYYYQVDDVYYTINIYYDNDNPDKVAEKFITAKEKI